MTTRIQITTADVHPAEWPAGITSGRGSIVFDALRTEASDGCEAVFIGRCHRADNPRDAFDFGPVSRMDIDD